MYRRRFGLTCHPLPKGALGKTYYEKLPGYQRLGKYFTQLVEDPGLGVLVGGAGLGKTAAIRNLCNQLPRPNHMVLYICDTSVFVTSAGVNPTLTAMAIADRAAGHILAAGRQGDLEAT